MVTRSAGVGYTIRCEMAGVGSTDDSRAGLREEVEDRAEQRVTPLELFFNLVFVFSLTQVTALMADDPT